jgi:hypothetical protein
MNHERITTPDGDEGKLVLEPRQRQSKAARRGTRGAFKGPRHPVIMPDYTTMSPKFLTPSQRLQFRQKAELITRGYEL